MQGILPSSIGYKYSKVPTGNGKPGKSWNVRILFSRPGKAWNLIFGPLVESHEKLKFLFGRLVAAGNKARIM